MSILASDPMKRTAFLLLLLACGNSAIVLGQQPAAPSQRGRQGGTVQPGREGGVADQGRGGRGAQPQGRQGGPARDRVPETGTASITGRVVSADTGAPVRRAEVQASIGGAPGPRAVLTDENGRFELRNLPAGRWMLRVAKTGFVPQQFGQRNPFTASEQVVLADRQQFIADFALTRGAAIMGRVYDEFGDPIANARVAALRFVTSANARRLVSAATSGPTDDTGAFRVYGLTAGEYYLAASLNSTAAVSGSLVSADGPVTYAPTYHPGTADIATAQRLTVRAGEEQSGIGLIVAPVRAVRLSGVVIGSAGTPINARITLESPVVADGAAGANKSAATAADGTFTIRGVPPGSYVLTATGRSASPNSPADVASMTLTVGGEDVAGLTLNATRGATISGTIAADNGTRVEFSGVRVTAPSMRAGGQGNQPRAQVTAAGAFEMSGLVGVHSLRFEQLPAGWAIKSVTANGVDVADTPMEFRGSNDVSVRVVLTNRLTELAGTIRSGNPLPRGATVVVFPDDPSKWTAVSRYLKTARAGETGQFTVRALPPAPNYLAIAIEYLENGEHLEPEFLQRVKARATRISLVEGEKKTLDLDLVTR